MPRLWLWLKSDMDLLPKLSVGGEPVPPSAFASPIRECRAWFQADKPVTPDRGCAGCGRLPAEPAELLARLLAEDKRNWPAPPTNLVGVGMTDKCMVVDHG